MIKEIGELTNLNELKLKKCIEIKYLSYMSARPACMYEGTECYDMQKHDINWDDLRNLSNLQSLDFEGLAIPEEIKADMKSLSHFTSAQYNIQDEYNQRLQRQKELRTTIYEKIAYNVYSVVLIDPSEILLNEEEPTDLIEDDDSTGTIEIDGSTETEVSENDDETDIIEIDDNEGAESVYVTVYDDDYTGTASETDDEDANTDTVDTDANESECPKGDVLGYDCCTHCHSIYEDEDGLWGVENKHWCVIPDHCYAKYEECWSVKYGYPCCDHCKVRLTDKDGKWGIMNKNWCGVPSSCN